MATASVTFTVSVAGSRADESTGIGDVLDRRLTFDKNVWHDRAIAMHRDARAIRHIHHLISTDLSLSQILPSVPCSLILSRLLTTAMLS